MWSVDNSPVNRPGKLKPEPKRIEVPMTDQMIVARNQLYIEPFDVFDPHKPNRGLKIFHENFRPYRRKASIAIEGEAVVKKKRTEGISVDPAAVMAIE
jgi:hypothetical protein